MSETALVNDVLKHLCDGEAVGKTYTLLGAASAKSLEGVTDRARIGEITDALAEKISELDKPAKEAELKLAEALDGLIDKTPFDNAIAAKKALQKAEERLGTFAGGFNADGKALEGKARLDAIEAFMTKNNMFDFEVEAAANGKLAVALGDKLKAIKDIAEPAADATPANKAAYNKTIGELEAHAKQAASTLRDKAAQTVGESQKALETFLAKSENKALETAFYDMQKETKKLANAYSGMFGDLKLNGIWRTVQNNLFEPKLRELSQAGELAERSRPFAMAGRWLGVGAGGAMTVDAFVRSKTGDGEDRSFTTRALEGTGGAALAVLSALAGKGRVAPMRAV